MSFELFLAGRYLRAKRKQAFISIITVISMLGVMVGVMALVVVLSVMNGFRADLMSKILGVNSHLLVLSFGGPFRDEEKAAQEQYTRYPYWAQPRIARPKQEYSVVVRMHPYRRDSCAQRNQV